MITIVSIVLFYLACFVLSLDGIALFYLSCVVSNLLGDVIE